MTTRGKILVVDDKSDIVETVSLCLSQEGFEVSTALDGEQALKVARREQPDLIVLDVMLPKENGYQVYALSSFARGVRDELSAPYSSLGRLKVKTAPLPSSPSAQVFLRR